MDCCGEPPQPRYRDRVRLRVFLAAIVTLSAIGVLCAAPAGAQTAPLDPASVAQPPDTPPPDPPPAEPPPPAAPPADDPAVVMQRFVAWLRSLMPPPPAGSGQGRRIVYSISRQRVWVVEADDQLRTTYLVSGRAGTPRPGTYRIFSKSRWSSSGSVRMQYMMRFARGRSLAIGFHSIPVRPNGRPLQSEAELGRYRSHGCVRQRLADAAFLWDWAPVGTTVVVVG